MMAFYEGFKDIITMQQENMFLQTIIYISDERCLEMQKNLPLTSSILRK